MLAHIAWGAFFGRLGVFLRLVYQLQDAGGFDAVSIVPHQVGQLGFRALKGVYVNWEGLESRVATWGLINQGVSDATARRTSQ